jgi:hypothetical protein
MPLVDVLDGKIPTGPIEGLAHGGEVVGHPAGGGVRCVADLGCCDVNERGAESLDVRGRHALRTKQ